MGARAPVLSAPSGRYRSRAGPRGTSSTCLTRTEILRASLTATVTELVPVVVAVAVFFVAISGARFVVIARRAGELGEALNRVNHVVLPHGLGNLLGRVHLRPRVL